MATLHLLGTGAAYSDPTRTTTMLAFRQDRSCLMVDCGGDAIQRLLASGIDPATIDRGPEIEARDLPGEGIRWVRHAEGVHAVLVNGAVAWSAAGGYSDARSGAVVS